MVREDVKRRGGGEGSGLQVEERERERELDSSGKRWPTPQFWVLPAVGFLAYRSANLVTIAERNKTIFNRNNLAFPPNLAHSAAWMSPRRTRGRRGCRRTL